MALEEAFALDAVGRADQRAWPALEVNDHPFADGFEVAREIQLGDGIAIAVVRPELLVRLGNDDSHHFGTAAGLGRSCASLRLRTRLGLPLRRGLGKLGIDRCLSLDLLRRLVLAQTLEGG